MIRRILAWCLILVWIGVIFGLSSKPASVSKNESRIITGIIQGVADKAYEENFIRYRVVVQDRMTRKAAHVTEYFTLSLLMMGALRISKIRHSACLTLAITVAYACLDELHQMSVPGRGPATRDVLIDSLGILIGIGAAKMVKLKS